MGLSWGIYSATMPDTSFDVGLSRYAEESAGWVEICRWVQEHGPRDTTYLTPPGEDRFISLSDRSNVVDFKNDPDGALGNLRGHSFEAKVDICSDFG